MNKSKDNNKDQLNVFITTGQLDKILGKAAMSDTEGYFTMLITRLQGIRDGLDNTVGGANVGKGFRNAGFMMMANESANNNPQFFPNFIDINDYNSTLTDYLFMRDVTEDLLGITETARAAMNILGNEGFRFTMAYYNNLRNIVATTANGHASSIFNTMTRFFHWTPIPPRDNDKPY